MAFSKFCRLFYDGDFPHPIGGISPVPATSEMTKNVGVKDGQLFTEPDTPDVTAADNGKILQVDDGKWVPSAELPDRVQYLEDHPYTLPQADAVLLGGVKAYARDEYVETQPVKIDSETGFLYTASPAGHYVLINGNTVNRDGYFAFKNDAHYVQMADDGGLTLGTQPDGSGITLYRDYDNVESGGDILTIARTNRARLRATIGIDEDEDDDRVIAYTMNGSNDPEELANKGYVDSHAGGSAPIYVHHIHYYSGVGTCKIRFDIVNHRNTAYTSIADICADAVTNYANAFTVSASGMNVFHDADADPNGEPIDAVTFTMASGSTTYVSFQYTALMRSTSYSVEDVISISEFDEYHDISDNFVKWGD